MIDSQLYNITYIYCDFEKNSIYAALPIYPHSLTHDMVVEKCKSGVVQTSSEIVTYITISNITNQKYALAKPLILSKYYFPIERNSNATMDMYVILYASRVCFFATLANSRVMCEGFYHKSFENTFSMSTAYVRRPCRGSKITGNI